MPRLIMKRGPEPGRSYELTGDVVIVGRGSKSDIIVQDNEVSRSHCRFLKVLTDYELHDMDSANGTFVNGQRVHEPWLLQNDCIIEIGDSITFHFERGSAPLDPTKVKEVPKVPRRGGSEHDTEESQVLKRHPYLVLNITSRGDTHEVFPLTEQTLSLGRDLSNTIVIQEPEVSRYHLRFTRTDNGYTVQDLGSTNGTTLNGAPLTEVQLLKMDDVLQIGSLINLLYTNEPEQFKSRIKTDTLPTTERPSINRETTPVNVFSNVSNISNRRKTSILGTGLQPGALEDHVFIAYSRDDWEAIVAPLMLRLQDAGLHVWVEQYLKPGQEDWVVAVEQALAECWLMVVVVSPAALEAKPVTLQYRYFYNREKPILTLLYKPTSAALPPELIKQRNVRYEERDRTKTFQRLIFEIMHSRMK